MRLLANAEHRQVIGRYRDSGLVQDYLCDTKILFSQNLDLLAGNFSRASGWAAGGQKFD